MYNVTCLRKGGKMYIRVISIQRSTQANFRQVYLGMISPRARARELHAICWPPHAFEDAKEVAARPGIVRSINRTLEQV